MRYRQGMSPEQVRIYLQSLSPKKRKKVIKGVQEALNGDLAEADKHKMHGHPYSASRCLERHRTFGEFVRDEYGLLVRLH